MLTNDFPQLAVIDAYKWWISSDYGFLRMTGAIDVRGQLSGQDASSIDTKRLRKIAQAYSVSRNIPSDQTDSQAQLVVDAFSKPISPDLFSDDLKKRALALKSLSMAT
jgi:hypothetical protein